MPPSIVVPQLSPFRIRRLARVPCRVLLAVIALTGCASVPTKGGLSGVQETTRQRTGLRVDWVQNRPEDSVAQAYVQRVLVGEVPVDSAIQIGLLRNKRLQASFEDLGIAQADLVQAGLLGSPVLSAGKAVARGGGTGIQSLGVALPFINFLQRPLRQRVARQEFDAARARMSAAVLSAVADIRIAYVEEQAALQLLELRRSVSIAMDASAIAATAIHAAGNLSDFDLAQERAQAADARLEVFRAEGEARVARAALERMMGVGGGQSWSLTSRLSPPTDTMVTETAMAETALERRLDLRAARSDASAAAQRLGLTRAFALLPDGTIGATYERDPDGTFIGGAISIPLPFLDRGQSRVARNRALWRQSAARHDALVVEIGAEVRELRASLASARDREDHLRRVVLPLRHQVVTESQKFVNAMEHSIFTLLLAKQAEIDAGQAYVTSLRDYWTTRARLERAVGGTFAPLTTQERTDAAARDSVGRVALPSRRMP